MKIGLGSIDPSPAHATSAQRPAEKKFKIPKETRFDAATRCLTNVAAPEVPPAGTRQAGPTVEFIRELAADAAILV
jgi:hypothetical protein